VGTSWVLATALDAVSGMVVAAFVDVVGGDVAAKRRGSGLERRGSGGCRGAVGRLGKVCRRFCGARGGFGAEDRVVVVVVDVVGIVDGGCAGVVNDDVVALAVKGRLVTRAAGSFSVWVVASVVSVVVCILKSMQSVVSAFFSEYKCSLSGGSVCRAAHRRSGAGLVCTAVSEVVVGVCVGVLQGLVFVCFATHCLRSFLIPAS
jgi:hypothetical protein